MAQTGRIQRRDAVRVEGEQTGEFTLLRGDDPEQHYPKAAREARLEGVVVVDLLLNEVGRVLEAQVISELPRGAGFGLAALDTAKTWEFVNPLRCLVLISFTIEFAP